MAIRNYRWLIKELDDSYKKLVETQHIHETTAKLLAGRKIYDHEEAVSFLNRYDGLFSSPYDFDKMDVAVERVKKAIDNKEHIIIYGDFDVDGVTGTTLLYKTFKHLEANFSYYIPDRTTEGHGLNTTAVCKLISSRKAKVIITTDCASSDCTEISLAKSLGVDVIITDHHELPETLPLAIAVLNTKLLPEDSPMSVLAGVGVAYKFSEALLSEYGKTDILEELLCLVSIGTIADLASLTKENRLLVSIGLANIARFKPKPIYKLLEKAKYNLNESVTAEKVGFGLGPRLNAVGRLDHAEKAVKLLVSEDEQEMTILAEEIEILNAQRKEMMDETYLEALRLVNIEVSFETDKIIVLASKNWHPGIIGVVASRLMDKFYLPVCLMVIDEENNKVDASCRSIPGVNIHQLLEENSTFFTRFGGHAGAGGFSAVLENMPKIKQAFKESVIRQITNPAVLDPVLNIDMEIPLQKIDMTLIEDMEQLAPFGMDNPAPLFCVRNATVTDHRFLGENNNHLKLILRSGSGILEALSWNTSQLNFDPAKKVDLVFSPEINCYGNSKKVQLIVTDIKQSALYQDESSAEPMIDEENAGSDDLQFVMLVDHRNKTDKQNFLQTLISAVNKGVAIFAEHYESPRELAVTCPIIDRYNQEKYDQIIFWELPPSHAILQNVVNNSKATTAHIVAGKNFLNTYAGDIIKPLILMLKYAINSKAGELSIADVAIKLATTKECIAHAVMLLHKSGFIQIVSKGNGNLKIEWGTNPVKSSIKDVLQELAAYNNDFKTFNKHIYNVTQYRSQLHTSQIKDLKKMLHSCNS